MKNQGPGFIFLIFLALALISTAACGQAKLTIKDFLAEPDVFDAEFSPDGRYLAMITKENKKRFLVIRDFDKEGQPVTGMMSDELIRPTGVNWANNDRLIVSMLVPQAKDKRKIRRRLKNDEDFDMNTFQMFHRSMSMDVKAKNTVTLMNNSFNLKYNYDLSRISNFLPNDKKHVIMPGWGNRTYQLFKVNIYTGHAEKITEGVSRTISFLTDETGRPTFRLDYYFYGKFIRVYRYAEDEDWEEFEDIRLNQTDEESISNDGLLHIGIGEDRNLIYKSRNNETGFYEIVKGKRGTDKKEVIASLPNQDIHSAIFDIQTDKYAGFTTQEDLIRHHFLDKERQLHDDQIVAQIGHYNFNILSSNSKAKRVIVQSSGANNLGDFFIYDRESKKLQFLREQSRTLAPHNLALPGKVHYKTRDGVKIRMYVLFPPSYKSGKSFPMVILPHGGPHIRDNISYDSFAQFIATRGYIVVKPNFRGSTGYGLEFEEAGYGQWGGRMQDDLTDAVNYMVKQGYADPKKVCIVGGSYGGYAALMGAIKTPDLYQCSVSLNGVTHLKQQIEHDIHAAKINLANVEELIYKIVGHPEKNSEWLDINSPALNASKIKIPLLIIAGNRDNVVPIEQAKLMVEALENNDKQFLYFKLNNTGHNIFRLKKDIVKVYTEVEEFLDKHLK